MAESVGGASRNSVKVPRLRQQPPEPGAIFRGTLQGVKEGLPASLVQQEHPAVG